MYFCIQTPADFYHPKQSGLSEFHDDDDDDDEKVDSNIIVRAWIFFFKSAFFLSSKSSSEPPFCMEPMTPLQLRACAARGN